MKRKLLFLSFLLILLFGFCNIIIYGNNENANHLPTLREVGVTDDFNTGIFYQTQPDFNEQINETYSFDNSRKVSLERQNVSPTNPFIGDTYVANKSFLTAYYSHLNQNMPNNSLGICGYTGISMFFSYYDSYWNDSFIPEQYESDVTKIRSSQLYASFSGSYESPGVKNLKMNETISSLKNKIKQSGITDENSTLFKEALDKAIMSEVYKQIDDGSFLGKLFEIAIANGSIKPHFIENEYHVANKEYVGGIGVSNEIMNNVISDYITNNSSLNGKVSIITSKLNNNSNYEKQRVRSEIVKLVKSGRPVLMGVNGYTDANGNGKQDIYPNLPDGTSDPRNEGSFGHVVIAYDYDEEKDILYGNMGWSSKYYSHYNLDEYFNIQMSDYWTLNISSELPRNRTNNYIYTDKTSFYSPGLNKMFNIISPQDYGFDDAYYNEKVEKEISLSNTNEKIITNRYRCGFIQGESINISTKKVSPGYAYLEYTFDKPISKIEVDLSWWSSNEKVNYLNSNYRIEYLIEDDIYFTSLDLWSANLSTNRNNPTKIIVSFPSGVKTFRFYGLTNSPVNDRNKGRLAIFDLVVEY